MLEKSEFGKHLFSLRKKIGLSQEELAERINVHLNTISQWENGIYTPKTEKIKKLAEALDVTESELLNGSEEQNWELKLIVKKGTDLSKEVIDLTGATKTATLELGDFAMGITLSAGYDLWKNDDKFEELIAELRKKRNAGLKMRETEW